MRLLIFLLILLLFSCGGVVNSGSSTETIGFVVDGQGNPVPGALITLIREDFNPQSGTVDLDSIYSDENGKYTLREVENGTYNVHFRKDNYRALRSGLVVAVSDSIRFITDTLKASAGLSGVIQHQNGDNHKGIFLLFMGTERYATTIDSAGNFLVENLAEGEYEIKIISELDNYESQTVNAAVVSGIVSTLEDTVVLAYTGIPTPKGLVATFNSEMQETNLTWEPVQSSKLKEYYVFRSPWNDSSNYQLIGSVCSTSFVDPIPFVGGAKNGRYYYRVQAVSDCGMSGKYSQCIKATIESSFEVSSLSLNQFPIEGEYKSLAMNGDVLYVAGSSNSIIDGYNLMTEELVSSDSIPHQGVRTLDIDVMSNGRLLVNSNKGFYLFPEGDEEIDPTTPNSKEIVTSFSSTVVFVDTNEIFYSAKEECLPHENPYNYEKLLLSFDPEYGKVRVFCEQVDRGIEDFYIFQNWIYILLKDKEKITLERSPLGRYEPEVLMCENIKSDCDEDHLSLSGHRDNVLLLCNSRVTLFDFDKKVMSTPVGKSIVEIEWASNEFFVALDKSGYLMRYKKSSKENSNKDN